MTIAAQTSIAAELRHEADAVTRALDEYTAEPADFPPRLLEAMRYSLLGEGKRLRPALVLWSCAACGGRREAALPAALAVECVHAFSLIHDDLPALDDDDFRRGEPSCHKKFDEATAILAGDALLALAFDILSTEVADGPLAAAMVRELAQATGGMIGGEALDLEGETQPPAAAAVANIHSAKTALLIRAACRLGALAAGADEPRTAALSAYGEALGLAFQVADDLLDVTGTFEATGKTTAKDAAAGKQTYPRAIGLDASRELARGLAARAFAALRPLGDAGDRLAALANFVVQRTS